MLKFKRPKVLIMILAILFCVGIATACVTNSTGKKSNDVKTTDKASETSTDDQTATGTETLEEPQATTNEGQTSTVTDTSEEPQTTEDIIDTTETVTQDVSDNGFFPLNSEGKIIGSPADYDTIVFNIGGITFSAKEYFQDNTAHIKEWHDMYSDKAAVDYSNDEAISLQFDDSKAMKCLELGMGNGGISYGSDLEMPKNPDAVDFSINGIKLGDEWDKIESVFGTPHKPGDVSIKDANGSSYLSYGFENTGSLVFRIYDNKIAQIIINKNY